MRTRENLARRRRQANYLARFLISLLVLGVSFGLGAAVWLRLEVGGRGLGEPSPALNPAERALLWTYLSARAAELAEPAQPGADPLDFSVPAGQTASGVAGQLAALGVVRDARLLEYYLRYRGLDGEIEAGDFRLSASMTVPELAEALTDASDRTLTVRLIEGWRLEQVAEALGAYAALEVTPEQFLALTGPGGPRAPFDYGGDIPEAASLEGFLFPDTYTFRPGAGPAGVLQVILGNFGRRLPVDYRERVTRQGLTVYQAVTVAALIEREAVVDDERALIASVIYNRLAIGQRLEIDASVQYALGGPGDWWPRLQSLDLRSIDSPYNTYLVPGLPQGPIANPGLASLLAVAAPAQSEYLYYRARCDGSGRHLFARTYEEHLANACP